MRLVFLGTPDAAVPSLRALVAARHDVALVVTPPDRRRGRGSATSPSPVGAAADELGLRVTHELGDVLDVDAQLGVVVAYGAMIPSAVLDRIDMLNVHFSLLPRWRGAAPVERAILAGDEKTGVCVMGLEATLDTGPVYARRETEIAAKSAAQLTRELAIMGANLLVETLAHDTLPTPEVQVGESTYAKKLSATDFELDPSLSAEQLARIVRLDRAVALVDSRRLAVLGAEVIEDSLDAGAIRVDKDGVVLGTASGALRLGEVRATGSRTMAASDWWRGSGLDATTIRWSRPERVGP